MHRAFLLRLLSPATAVAAALVPAIAGAQWMKPGTETFAFRVGAVTQDFDTTARVDGSAAGGTSIDLERDAGIGSDKTTYLLQATWRVASHHRIDGLYSDVTRSGARSLDRAVTIGNINVPAGTVLSAEQKTAIGYLGYRYSLVKSQDVEIAAGIGAYGGKLKASFTASSPAVNSDQSTTVPLPVLTLSADAYLSDRLTLNGTLRGLKLKVNDVDGQVFSLGAGVEYLLTNNVGLGLAFERFNVAVDARKPSLNGRLEIDSSAGRLYLTARF